MAAPRCLKTLVVHVGGIGDFLLAGPAIRQLALDGPVELLGRRERLQLAVAGGIAAAAHDMDAVGFDSVFSCSAPSPLLLDFLSGFDRAVVWMRAAQDVGRVFGECIPDVRLFPGLPPDDWTAHASDYYTGCIGGGAAMPARFRFNPRPGCDVVIHPGSGGKRKNWPLDNFQCVAAALERQGRHVTWCTGPAEEAMPLPARGARLTPERLVSLAETLAAARLYIGNDSGITHLAAAAGCPAVAVFGPTDPAVWAPLGPHVRVAMGTPWPEPALVVASTQSLLTEAPPE